MSRDISDRGLAAIVSSSSCPAPSRLCLSPIRTPSSGLQSSPDFLANRFPESSATVPASIQRAVFALMTTPVVYSVVFIAYT